jgi:SAM-dependent methyltransferase
MAITRHLAEFVLAEHRFRKISGKILLLGRQTVFLTPDQAQELIEKCGIQLRPGARIDYDKMPYGREKRFISDVSFFSLFSDATVVACDVSDAEGADIIFSLSDEPPRSMIGTYDFIYNGSVLDNVFDPAGCIRNVSRMMKPDGVVFHYEGAAHFNPAYLKFTPDWMFDFYALNGFADFQAYLCTFRDVHASTWSVFEWSAYISENSSLHLTMPMKYAGDGMVVAIAQNSSSASISETPIQNIYRTHQEEYQAAFMRYAASPRRVEIRKMLSGAAEEQLAPTLPRKLAGEKTPMLALRGLLRWARRSPLKSLVPIAIKQWLLRVVVNAAPSGTSVVDATSSQPSGHIFLGTIG